MANGEELEKAVEIIDMYNFLIKELGMDEYIPWTKIYSDGEEWLKRNG